MSEPLGYLLTWTTYGTWLPGDDRGWVDGRHRTEDIVAAARPTLEQSMKGALSEPPLVLDESQRGVTQQAIRSHCKQVGWHVHALSVRSNHVHVVVTAPQTGPAKAIGVLKSAATKALKPVTDRKRTHWWTVRGSKRFLNTEVQLAAAVRYVCSQNVSWKKGI